MNLTVINLEILQNCYNKIVLSVCKCQMEYRARETGISLALVMDVLELQEHRYQGEGQEKRESAKVMWSLRPIGSVSGF